MDKNIFLIGFMGTGKSTIAKELNKKLGMEIIEMDQVIVDRQGMSINDIFEKFGETAFRDIESALVEEIKETGGKIVSCGGGVVVRPENVACMKENGKIILLSATPETVYERVKDNTDRPILNGNMNVEYIAQLMEKRRALYLEAADNVIVVDGKSVEEIAEDIISVM